MITKGGITGLPESDFYKRQKSGDWSIDEHFEDVNYIRTRSFTPNNYLATGCYETDEILVYDIFNNQVSSLTKPITGTDLPSISCISYNKNVGHLAIGQNKAPFLRVFDTSVGDMSEFVISDLYIESSYLVKHPVFIKRFRQRNLVNNILRITHNLEDVNPATCMLSRGPNISYPYEIEIIDENTLDIVFHETSDNLSGIVYIHSYEGNSSHVLESLDSSIGIDYTTYQLDLSAYEHTDVVFQVYNSDNKMIIPAYIQEITKDKIYNFMLPNSFNPEGTTILVVQGFYTHSESFTVDSDYTSVTINHFLHSKYLCFQVFDTVTGLTVYPSNIHINDKDNILISTDSLIVFRTYKVHISKSPPDYGIPEFLIGEPPSSMVTCLGFDANGERLLVGTLEAQNESNIIEFNTSNYIRSVELDLLKTVPTTIKTDLEDNYLFVGHYSNSLIDRNLTLYDYQTKKILDIYDFSTLKENTKDSVTDSCFVNTYKLLILGSYYTPFLYFYDFIQKENVTTKYTDIIANSIISRVTNIIKTNDDKYVLIAIDTNPYLFILDLSQNKINSLRSDCFVSSFTSLSLSVNDTYLCVTQRDSPNISVFEFKPITLIPVDINYTPNSTPLSSKFFFGPVSSES